MTRRPMPITFKLPPLLRTKKDREAVKPLITMGRQYYADYGWNLTGRRDTYLVWMEKLEEVTKLVLRALNRTQGGIPCRDHLEARMPPVHDLIRHDIEALHGVALPDGSLDKTTTARPIWVAASTDGEPLGWVPLPENRTDWRPGEIRIYKGWRLNGRATETLKPTTRAGTLRKPSTFYDDGFIQEPQQSQMFTNDPRDVLYTGPVILREAFVIATFTSMFAGELFDDAKRRKREAAGSAWAARKRDAFRTETLRYRHVMPQEAGDYVCMGDEATVMGRDIQAWTAQLIRDLWLERQASDARQAS